MSISSLILLLIIAAVCGSIGQRLVSRSRSGCLISIAMGFIGALIGKWLAAELGLSLLLPLTIGGEVFPVAWSILGAALFSLVLGLLKR